MREPAGAEALFNFWKTQMEEATKIWARAVSQTQAADPAQFWRPVMDPAISAWAEVLARGPVSPEVMGQWKQFLDQWIDAWGKALESAMQTDAFAQALGRYLDQWVAVQAPARKMASQMSESTAAALGVASGNDVAAMRRQLTDLEDRLDDLQEQMHTLIRRSDAPGGQGRPRTKTVRPQNRSETAGPPPQSVRTRPPSRKASGARPPRRLKRRGGPS